MKININFLKPRLLNTLFTIVIFSLPLVREKVQLPTGGFVVDKYIPFHLLFTYVQMRDYLSFIQMIGFLLVVYFTVSAVVEILSKSLHRKNNSLFSH